MTRCHRCTHSLRYHVPYRGTFRCLECRCKREYLGPTMQVAAAAAMDRAVGR